jgi:hypothetical protein
VIAATGTNAGFPVRDATQRLLGNSQPDWIGGINNVLSYKNFTLSFLWETQQGQERYNQLGNFMAAFGIAKFTENRNSVMVFDGVLPNGQPNTQPVWLNWGTGPDNRVYSQGYYRNIYRTITENFVEDASWIRLRNLSLSYNIPTRILGRTFVKVPTSLSLETIFCFLQIILVLILKPAALALAVILMHLPALHIQLFVVIYSASI